MSLFSAIRGIFTVEEDDYIEEESFDVEPEPQERNFRVVSNPAFQNETQVQVQTSNRVYKPERSKVHDYWPQSYDDVETIIPLLRYGKTVVLHLPKDDTALAQRQIDFAAGVARAFGCTTDHVCSRNGRYIFIIVPPSVSEQV